jgi:hypothetical protein
MPEAFVSNTIKSKAFLSLNEFANLCMSQGLTFPDGMSSTDESRTSSDYIALIIILYFIMCSACFVGFICDFFLCLDYTSSWVFSQDAFRIIL